MHRKAGGKGKEQKGREGNRMDARRFLWNFALEISQLAYQLVEQTAHAPKDTISICLLLGQLARINEKMYKTASKQRQSFGRLPSEMLMTIASCNKNPSLRSIGLTCKTWWSATHPVHRCLQWTKAVHHVASLPLREFAWFGSTKRLSWQTTFLREIITFTDKDVIAFDVNDGLLHYPVHWSTTGVHWTENIHLPIQKRIRYGHVTSEWLRVLVSRGNSHTVLQFNRNSTGSLLLGTRQLWSLDGEKMRGQMMACAWSLTSLFVVLIMHSDERVILVEYGLNGEEGCVECKRLDFTGLLYPEFDDCEMDMTWLPGGVLLLAVSWDYNDVDETREIQLLLLHWATGSSLSLRNKRCRCNEFIASLQLFGLPYMYISLHMTVPHATSRFKLNVWTGAFTPRVSTTAPAMPTTVVRERERVRTSVKRKM
jgi:hypothetical protein